MANLIKQHRAVLEKKHYVRKAKPDLNYWFDFSKHVLEKYVRKFGEDFNLILFGSSDIKDDYFVLPYGAFKHIFSDTFLARDDRERWIGIVRYNELRVTNCPIKPDITAYYGETLLLGLKASQSTGISEEEQNDYAIENRKIEVKARQKQSLFRRRVLSNFGYRCCLTGIKERELLVASHIVPWSERKDTRLDPKNGLCLFVLYDSLFDAGYFSLSDENEVVITPKMDLLSPRLQDTLRTIEGQKIRTPISHQLKLDYVQYHRRMKLIR